MSNAQVKAWNDVLVLMEKYQAVVAKGLRERWRKFDIELFDSEIYEVIGGLLARQATLTIEFAGAPQIWNAHIAPLILRSMIDAHITFAWILKSPKDRAKQYVMYGLGQEKLYIEHLKANGSGEERDERDERIDKAIKFKEAWLNSQRAEFAVEVNVGSWSGLNTRNMAGEAGCESLYNFAYMPFSGATHNMWQHISFYNLETCKNALHKFHKIPAIVTDPPQLDYVYRSAKYVDLSYSLFDQTYNISAKTPLPHSWFVRKLKKFAW